jgi:aspartate/methionine/tyrosine aminotransferase
MPFALFDLLSSKIGYIRILLLIRLLDEMSIERLVRNELKGPSQRSSTRMRMALSSDMISLGAGDPNFILPKYISETIEKAILDGYTHYCFGGDPELKLAISNYYKRYGYEADSTSQVSITAGGSQSIFTAYATVLNNGDEVIAFDPAYGGGSRAPRYFGVKTIFTPMTKSEGGSFRFNEEALKEVISEKTKVLYLENPGNPSGIVYSEEELKTIADLAIDHDFLVLSDETYSEFIWVEKKHTPLIAFPGMENRTLVAMALTKMFAWAGMRTGWIISGPEMSSYVSKAPGSSISWPIQKGAIAALNGPRDFIEGMKNEYEERIDYCVKRLNGMHRIKCAKPEGAFYLFPDITGTGLKSDEFTRKLLEEEKIRVVSGSSYGVGNGEGNIRLSMVCPLIDQKMKSWLKVNTETCLEAAMDRMERFCEKYTK